MVSKNLRKNLAVLKLISLVPDKIQRAVISNSDHTLIAAICEIALNCCVGNIKLSPSQLNKLRKYNKRIRALASVKCLDRNCSKEKRIINQQRGGSFLPFLIAPALDIISDIILN